jgi:hypothetical protein
MTAVSGAIANLVGGVSQQPPEIRTLNTAADLINTWSDVVSGLTTRPSCSYLGTIADAPIGDASVATHTIEKPTGRYKLAVYGGEVHVLNLATGLPETVIVEDADSYLDIEKAAENIRFVTVSDTTFIFNRSVTCTLTEVPESGSSGSTEDGTVRLNPNLMGTMWVKQQSGYACNYALYLNNTQVALKTTTDSGATATAICTSLVTAATTSGLTISKVSNTIATITFATETDFITTLDDYANQAMQAYNDSVEEFTDLPNMDVEGRMMLVSQSSGTTQDDYWVWYKNGRWEETYGWNAYEKPDAETMPHVLVDNKDGTWTLKQHDWAGREVGDADSNPTPSFIGATINDMFLYKGRMVILADENFMASQVGNYENFYRSTCTELLDEDVIDIAAPMSRGAALVFGKEFNETLIVSSEFDQFAVTGSNDGLLGPNSVSIKHANAYNASGEVDPVFAGPNFIFVDDFSAKGFASLREYQVERVFGRQIALTITDQIPEYIPSGVYKLASSSSDDLIVLLTSGDRGNLWLYNFYYNNDGKVQSAWQKWEMPFSIYGAEFLDDKLTMTVAYNGKLHVVSVKFSMGLDADASDDSILLDMATVSDDLTVSFDGYSSTVTLPFEVLSGDLEKIRLVISSESTGSKPQGQILVPTSVSGAELTFSNVDLTGDRFVVGFRYRFYWKLNPIYVRDKNLVAVQDGRLQLRTVSLLYNSSGPFDIIVTPPGRDSYTDKFTNFVVGAASSPIGSLTFKSGKYRTAAYGQADRVEIAVEAYTPWRVRFSSLEWDGAYRPRRKRTT